jgi:hypothetical protein
MSYPRTGFILPVILNAEDVTLLRYDDFFASKPVVFSAAFCEKSKKSQPLRGADVHFLRGFAPCRSAPGLEACFAANPLS